MYSKTNKYRIEITGFPSDESIIDYIGWDIISKWDLDEKIIEHNKERINWDIYSKYGNSDLVLERHADKINMENYFFYNKNKTKNINLMVRIKQYIPINIPSDPRMINYYDNPDFIDAFHDKINWDLYIINFDVPDYLIERYWNFMDKTKLVKNQKIPHKCLEQHKLDINWNEVLEYQNLDENVILDLQFYLNWDLIFKYQKLSSNFIKNNVHKCYEGWKKVAMYQNLDEKFIEINRDKFDMNLIFRFQNLSYEFLKKYKDQLDADILIQNIHFNKKTRNVRIFRDYETGELFILPPTSTNHKRINAINFVKY